MSGKTVFFRDQFIWIWRQRNIAHQNLQGNEKWFRISKWNEVNKMIVANDSEVADILHNILFPTKF